MSTKILGVGDVHYRSKNPVHRIDNYEAAIFEKLIEIESLTNLHAVDAVVFTGDIFSKPEVSITELVAICGVIKRVKCPVVIIPGNHDIYGYNIDTLERTSLYLLSLICNNVILLTEDRILNIHDFILTGQHYSGKVDVEGHGYDCVKHDVDKGYWASHTHLHTVHGMLLPDKPIFDKYTLINDVNTTADIVFAGHYHPGWKTVIKGKTTFVNSGAICRESATEAEMTRKVGISLFEATGNKHVVTFLPLLTAKPGNEVLSRIELDEKKEAKLDVAEFNNLLQSRRTGVVFTNVLDMIGAVAKEKSLEEAVVTKAIKLVTAKQESLSKTELKLR